MTKIVYNACFGGFGISKEAVLLGRKLSGDPKWGGVLKGEKHSDRTISDFDYNSHGYDLSRTDPILVAVVEKLGKEANGANARLKIQDLPKGTHYVIDEYDGSESINTRDGMDWEIA